MPHPGASRQLEYFAAPRREPEVRAPCARLAPASLFARFAPKTSCRSPWLTSRLQFAACRPSQSKNDWPPASVDRQDAPRTLRNLSALLPARRTAPLSSSPHTPQPFRLLRSPASRRTRPLAERAQPPVAGPTPRRTAPTPLRQPSTTSCYPYQPLPRKISSLLNKPYPIFVIYEPSHPKNVARREIFSIFASKDFSLTQFLLPDIIICTSILWRFDKLNSAPCGGERPGWRQNIFL